MAPVCVACTCPFCVRGIWESGVRVYSLSSRLPVLSPCRTKTIRLGSLRVGIPYVYPSPSTFVSLSRSCSGMHTASSHSSYDPSSSMLASLSPVSIAPRRADLVFGPRRILFSAIHSRATAPRFALETSRPPMRPGADGDARAPRANISSCAKEKTTQRARYAPCRLCRGGFSVAATGPRFVLARFGFRASQLASRSPACRQFCRGRSTGGRAGQSWSRPSSGRSVSNFCQVP